MSYEDEWHHESRGGFDSKERAESVAKFLFHVADNEIDGKDARIAELEAERDALVEAMQGLLQFAEKCEVQIDGEWGDCRKIDEIAADGDLHESIICARDLLDPAK